jgi:hypothetical protein
MGFLTTRRADAAGEVTIIPARGRSVASTLGSAAETAGTDIAPTATGVSSPKGLRKPK